MKKIYKYTETRSWYFELDVDEKMQPEKALTALQGTEGFKYNPATCGQIVGQMLLDANYVSVNEYYGKHTRAHEFKLTQKQDGKPFTLGEKYGCIECYEYQACQQPGYDNSEIRDALDYAKDDLARKMLKKLGEEFVWGLE